MTNVTYEIRYHPELSWFDFRYHVYVKDRYDWHFRGIAMTKWGARKVINRQLAKHHYTVVEQVAAQSEENR